MQIALCAQVTLQLITTIRAAVGQVLARLWHATTLAVATAISRISAQASRLASAQHARATLIQAACTILAHVVVAILEHRWRVQFAALGNTYLIVLEH